MSEDRNRNVILICLDSVRKDYFDKTASKIPELADVSFEQCRTASSWSAPSYLLVGSVWFVFQVLFLDFDGYADLLLAFPFFVIVAGHYYEYLYANHQHILQYMIAILFLVSVIASGGVGIGFSPMNDSRSMNALDQPLFNAAVFSFAKAVGMSPRKNKAIDQARASGSDNLNISMFAGELPPAHEIYWEKNPPKQCLYWVNKQSVSYFRSINDSPTQTKCIYNILG